MTVSSKVRPRRAMPPWAAYLIMWLIGVLVIALALLVGWVLFEGAWLMVTR